MKLSLLLCLFFTNMVLASETTDIELPTYQFDRLFTNKAQRTGQKSNAIPSEKFTLSEIISDSKHKYPAKSANQKITVSGFIFDAKGNETVWIANDQSGQSTLYRNEEKLKIRRNGVSIGRGKVVPVGRNWENNLSVPTVNSKNPLVTTKSVSRDDK